MKRFTAIVCSIAFAFFGICIAMTPTTTNQSGYKTMAAATTDYVYPMVDLTKLQVPEDLSLDLAKKKALDTVYITKTDTIEKQVTKVKLRKVSGPTQVVHDTLYVPKYYLATQTGNKEGPADKCVSVYEVHQVDEICPENTNSSVLAPQRE